MREYNFYIVENEDGRFLSWQSNGHDGYSLELTNDIDKADFNKTYEDAKAYISDGTLTNPMIKKVKMIVE